MRSSTEQVMSIMPTAPKSERAKVLAGVGGVALKEVERSEEGDEDDSGDDEVEEDGEGVDLDGSREGGDAPEGELVPARASGCEDTQDGEPAERLAGGAGGQGRARRA